MNWWQCICKITAVKMGQCSDEKIIESAEMEFLRAVAAFTCLDFKRNTEV
jgi:hypothetical protein